jgi:hypothetical protein
MMTHHLNVNPASEYFLSLVGRAAAVESGHARARVSMLGVVVA